MLYTKPGIEILKMEKNDVIRTSEYHNPNDDTNDQNNTSNLWPV